MRGKRARIRTQLRTANRKGIMKNPKELASCYGKVRHSSYEAARNANAEKIEYVRPYKCGFCPFYHVGRRTAKKT